MRLPELDKNAIEVHPLLICSGCHGVNWPIDELGERGTADCDFLEVSVLRRDGFERHDGPWDVKPIRAECHFSKLCRFRKVD